MQARWKIAASIAVGISLWPQEATAQEYSLTPDGPATLDATWRGPVPAGGYFGTRVLRAWRADVGPGGRAGTVRPRIATPDRVILGDPVLLPAEPGTYTFPTAPVAWGKVVGIEQTTGGHSLVVSRPCRADFDQFADPCRISWVDVFAGGPPPIASAIPTIRLPGAQLAIVDDYAGPPSTGTDLRVIVGSSRDAAGRLRIAVTVKNAGQVTAANPGVTALGPRGFDAEWEGPCLGFGYWGTSAAGLDSVDCGLEPVAPGGSRTATLVTDPRRASKLRFQAHAELAETSTQDNSAELAVAPLPRYALTAARRHSLSRTLHARVRAARPGLARISAAFAVGGRSVRLERTLELPAARYVTVTLRPTAAELRALRRAARTRALAGTITVGPLGGRPAATSKITIRRAGR